MASFDDSTYTPPGVYTQTVLQAASSSPSGTQRLPVLIGEGVENFTISNQELHRGSSASSDDQIVGVNLSAQVTGATRSFQLPYFPVVSGNGTGTVTNDPSKIQVSATAPGLTATPVAVLSLNGATGQFTTQAVIPQGSNLQASFYFKKTDTLITNEDNSSQVPSFASLVVQNALLLTLSIPGALGNDVSIALTLAAAGAGLGVADVQAVTGAGTDAISIELRKPDDTVRLLSDVANLITAGIETTSGGYLQVATGAASTLSAAALPPSAFYGGAGQSTNTTFKVSQVPVVDGTNGGIVTMDPTKIKVLVSGQPAAVAALNGLTGLYTLANAVQQGATIEATYYTNTYQDTSDALPSNSVVAISHVGLGPNRSDFTQGVDYVLNGNSIAWGASVNAVAGNPTPGYTALDATVIDTTLVDEQVFLQFCSGASSGSNSVFTLPDTPVDGSGLGRTTDQVSLVQIYVGPDPITAHASGAVKVARLSGASAQVTLFNPAPQGQNVYATYFRSVLADQAFTVTVGNTGTAGQGTYAITDSLGQGLPSANVGSTFVANSNFETTGVVWPNADTDLRAAVGGAAETVTVTFQNDGLGHVVTPAVQATLTVEDTNNVPRISFRATTPGAAGNSVSVALLGGPYAEADTSAIAVIGNEITVATVKADGATTRSWHDIVNLFATFPVAIAGAGTILCTGVEGADLTPQVSSLAATPLAGGAAAVALSYSNRFRVTTSRTAANNLVDALGLTGGATTPNGSNTGQGAVGAVGYLGQTYNDPVTGFKFTLIDPASALSYGYTQLPSPSYQFTPGDTLTFVVANGAVHPTGVDTNVIPGVKTNVATTRGMHQGDTAVISTFNRAGKSPAVGEYYYVTYTTGKQAADYAAQVFTSAQTGALFATYGAPNTANRLSLAAQLLFANGAQQVVCIQVPAQQGLGLAADQSFIDAINGLATPVAAGRKPDVIVPLSTSTTVQQVLGLFLTKAATYRNKGEAMGIVGFGPFTTSSVAAQTAQALHNNRVLAVMPGSLGILIPDPTTGVQTEYLVDGSFAAAALAGLMLDPANDVATDLSGQQVVGFSRSLTPFDVPTMDQMAAAGITVLRDVPGALEVRHYKTTDPTTILTSTPQVTTANDYIAKAFRSDYKQFVGRKDTSDLPSSMEAVGNARLSNLVGSIIAQSGPVSVAIDPLQPQVANVSVMYVPLFSILWVYITFKVNLAM